MRPSWMIYGANGYTGTLCARLAKSRGLTPLLAGRNAARLGPLAAELGLEARAFDLEVAAEVDRGLAGIQAVLHCAGPFSATARPMIDACMRTGTHYLDITGEIAVFEDVHARNAEIRAAGIAVIPGVGFDVVPTDCLAALLHRELRSATHLKLAFKARHGDLSPGTTKTMLEGLPGGGRIRRDGRIVSVPVGWKVEEIPFTAESTTTAVTIPWGDVSTAFHSTGIPNIETFVGASDNQIRRMKMPGWLIWVLGRKPVQSFLKAQIGKRVKGPDAAARAKDEMFLYAEVRDETGVNAGTRLALRLRTPEGYSLTADSAVTATLKVLEASAAGTLDPGAHTPSQAFGADFVLGLDGVRLERVK